MKKVKIIVIVDTITDAIARPIAKSFWKKAEEVDNIKAVNIDTLLDKAIKSKELEEEFNKLPEWLKQYVGNSRKSDFIN